MKVEITQEWVDKAKDLAHQYAIDYSFVIAGSHKQLFEHLQSAIPIDPFFEMKELYARDIESCKDIDGIEAYQLWQFLNNATGIWEDCATTPCCQANNEYRRHPHADNMILFHKCKSEDKKRWQFKVESDTWVSCKYESYAEDQCPQWRENIEYRIKPHIIGVTLDDGTIIEFPEPVRDPLDYAEFYYIYGLNGCISRHSWTNSDHEMLWLEQNKIYKTEEDCKAAQSAINKIMSLRS